MKQYIIAKGLQTDEIIILTLDQYSKYLPGTYEPLDSANTKKEAEIILRHIKNVGVQEYFREIAKEARKTKKDVEKCGQRSNIHHNDLGDRINQNWKNKD